MDWMSEVRKLESLRALVVSWNVLRWLASKICTVSCDGICKSTGNGSDYGCAMVLPIAPTSLAKQSENGSCDGLIGGSGEGFFNESDI